METFFKSSSQLTPIILLLQQSRNMTTVSVEKILVKGRLWDRIKDISNGKILTVFITVNQF